MKDTENVITTKYNIVLFCIFIVFQTIASLFEYEEGKTLFIDKIFNHSGLLGSLLLVALFFASATVGVWLIRSFWGRFVSQVFKVRALTINEAISIILIISIFSID